MRRKIRKIEILLMDTTESSATGTLHTYRASTGSPVRALLLVTAIAGTLDIIAAYLQIWAGSGKFPFMMLKGIAAGALGVRRAMQGGVGTMALGLFFHYFISFAFTLLFFLLYPRVSLLRKNPYVIGTVYALFTWAVMNYIVMPLSALPWPLPDFGSKQLYIGLIVFVLIFGLPIVFGTSRFYCRREA